jgi:hypothetical protein
MATLTVAKATLGGCDPWRITPLAHSILALWTAARRGGGYRPRSRHVTLHSTRRLVLLLQGYSSFRCRLLVDTGQHRETNALVARHARQERPRTACRRRYWRRSCVFGRGQILYFNISDAPHRIGCPCNVEIQDLTPTDCADDAGSPELAIRDPRTAQRGAS